MIWTREDDAQLLRGIQKGLTAQKIGDLLGRTRNAIIGRAHRLNFTFKSRDSDKKKIRKKSEPKPIKEPPKSLAMSLLSLRHNQCRWPFETTFCEEVRTPGMSYCPTHHKMSFRLGRPL